jgi:hypothetical protein
MPAHADTVALIPILYAGSYLVDCPGDFVSGNAGIRNAGKQAFFGHHIAVTNPTGLNTNPDLSRPRLWDLPLDNLQVSPGSGYLNGFHLRHSASPVNLLMRAMMDSAAA